MSWGTDALSYIKRYNTPTVVRLTVMNTFQECETVRLWVQAFILFRLLSLRQSLYFHWSHFKVSLAFFPSLTHPKILNVKLGDCFIMMLLVQQFLWKCSAHNLWRLCVINDQPQTLWKTWANEIPWNYQSKMFTSSFSKKLNFTLELRRNSSTLDFTADSIFSMMGGRKSSCLLKRREMIRPCRSHRTSYKWTSLQVCVCVCRIHVSNSNILW